MIAKLELYAVILLLIAGAFGSAYWLGRHDQLKEIHLEQLQVDNAAMRKAADAAIARADVDDKARAAGQTYIDIVTVGLGHAQQTFGKLSQVVADARGCSVLSPNFGLRWNSVADLPGALGPRSGQPDAAVPANAVPPAGGPR